jgi:hypothetical protein
MLPYPNTTGSWTVSSTAGKYFFALKATFSAGLQWQNTRSVQLANGRLLPFNTIIKTGSFGVNIKAGERVVIDYKATHIQTASHSAVDASANHLDQLQQQASVEYNPLANVHFQLSGQHYLSRQAGNPHLQYFFADGSVKFSPNKWKTHFELSAANILNVKSYRAFYLSANTLTASSYTLPGRIVLLSVIFKI